MSKIIDFFTNRNAETSETFCSQNPADNRQKSLQSQPALCQLFTEF
jgi:hypothetical protein